MMRGLHYGEDVTLLGNKQNYGLYTNSCKHGEQAGGNRGPCADSRPPQCPLKESTHSDDSDVL